MTSRVRRFPDAFGRQVHSFETDLDFDGLSGDPMHAVFIRAPWVEKTGSDVEVLRVNGRLVVIGGEDAHHCAADSEPGVARRGGPA